MNYIVFDLEWNQSSTGAEEEAERLPFEIVEIGAVKLDDTGVRTGEFNRLIRPQVYKQMHRITGELIHLDMEQLENEHSFAEVAQDFLNWCGTEPYLFCTWGSLDLMELQRNMEFYDMTPLSDGPIAYLDVQKLFSLAYEDGKSRRSLEAAVDLKQLEKDVPFHRAFDDAWYTAALFRQILTEKPETLARVSYDVFHPPVDRKAEIKAQFDTYVKYISREFENKAEAFADKEVASSKCYLCHRNLRKKVRWFSVNGRHYYCLAYCEKHGYLKGKIRLRRSGSGKVYVVKTTKLISEQEAQAIRERSLKARKLVRR